MKKIIICAFYCFIYIIANSVSAQPDTIVYLSDFLTNERVPVNITFSVFNNYDCIFLSTNTFNDTVFYTQGGAGGINDIEVQHEKFLRIVYRSARSGSGEGAHLLKILTVKNGVLYEGLTLYLDHESYWHSLSKVYKLSYNIVEEKGKYSIKLREKVVKNRILVRTHKIGKIPLDTTNMLFYSKTEMRDSVCIYWEDVEYKLHEERMFLKNEPIYILYSKFEESPAFILGKWFLEFRDHCYSDF